VPIYLLKHIVEDVLFMEWENPYIDTSNRETGRVSIKEKLAEKKAVIEQRNKSGSLPGRS